MYVYIQTYTYARKVTSSFSADSSGTLPTEGRVRKKRGLADLYRYTQNRRFISIHKPIYLSISISICLSMYVYIYTYTYT